jgi:hypothetical protein
VHLSIIGGFSLSAFPGQKTPRTLIHPTVQFRISDCRILDSSLLLRNPKSAIGFMLVQGCPPVPNGTFGRVACRLSPEDDPVGSSKIRPWREDDPVGSSKIRPWREDDPVGSFKILSGTETFYSIKLMVQSARLNQLKANLHFFLLFIMSNLNICITIFFTGNSVDVEG